MRRVDHKVDLRAYETLVFIAMRERQEAGVDHLCIVNWRKFVERYIGREFPGRGKLSLVLFQHEAEPFVALSPFSLNVNEEVWSEAERGEPFACFQLLHELAHILMHRHPTYSFSVSETSQLKYAQNEESAEWQANIFSAVTMAPPYLAMDCMNSKGLYERFNFPSEFADFWLHWRKLRPLVFASEYCSRCGNYQLVRIAGHFRCVNCGLTTK